MPNWCYTRVCFKGKPENIIRLRKDIENAANFTKANPRYCNLRYLLSLNNFDTVSYLQRYKDSYDCNFRGSVYDYPYQPEENNGYLLYYPSFEMAWDMDYNVLQLISIIYGVEFSAYSEESGMGIRTKCKNGSIDTYDFDYTIIPDIEQFEDAINEDPEGLDLDYDNPVKYKSAEALEIKKILHDCNIEYDIQEIEEVPVPIPYGVYYHYIYGVRFDTEFDKIWNGYPYSDPFNRYLTKGVYYDDNN